MAASGDKKRRTIKDVAAEADVSISTVSLALNGTGYVSAGTRRRVLAAAEKMSYVPRTAARQLASSTTGNIGFVLRADHFARSEPFYTHIFLGTEFAADKQKLYVLLATIPQSYTGGTESPRFLRDRNVDGVIIAGKVDPTFVAEVEETGLPVVLVDFEHDGLPAVVTDNQLGARLAVEHLVQLQHTRIAFVGADMEHPAMRDRLDGFRLGMANAGLAVPEERIITDAAGNPDSATGRELSETLAALKSRPTAVFCANDALAVGVVDGLSRSDISVPDDVSVVGFDDVAVASSCNPPLTTVRVFKQQLGELAVQYLYDLIRTQAEAQRDDDRSSRPHDLKVPVELVIRQSTSTVRTPAGESDA